MVDKSKWAVTSSVLAPGFTESETMNAHFHDLYVLISPRHGYMYLYTVLDNEALLVMETEKC